MDLIRRRCRVFDDPMPPIGLAMYPLLYDRTLGVDRPHVYCADGMWIVKQFYVPDGVGRGTTMTATGQDRPQAWQRFIELKSQVLRWATLPETMARKWI